MAMLRKQYTRLRLRVNETKSAVARVWGRKFLGFSFWVAKGRVIKIRVADKALKAMKARVRQITSRTGGRSIGQVVAELRSYLIGWKVYFRLVDTPGVLRNLDEWIRHRLRMIHLKQWKRGRTAYRELRARGLPELAAAKVAANTRRWWRNSAMLINAAFPISYFDGLGMPRLVT